MGLTVTITTPESSMLDKIEDTEADLAIAKSNGNTKEVKRLTTKLNNLIKKKQSMMDTAGDKGEESLLPKEAPIPKPRPQQKSKGGGVKKPAMAYGGMANKKKHMYVAGGSVKDYKPMQ